MKVVCITNDVEATSIFGEAYREDIAKNVAEVALPALLALYRKYNVKATFFCLASYVQKYPQIIDMIQADGHEVACHGYTHESNEAFDMLSYEEQLNHLKCSKHILDSLANDEVISFRAPALRVNEYTPQALKNAGFKIDSSVAPQRLDAFMSLGSKRKLQWIGAPRTIYETSTNNLARKGTSTITEVPISAFGLPYISTLMRVSPFMNRLARRCVAAENNHYSLAGGGQEGRYFLVPSFRSNQYRSINRNYTNQNNKSDKAPPCGCLENETQETQFRPQESRFVGKRTHFLAKEGVFF